MDGGRLCLEVLVSGLPPENVPWVVFIPRMGLPELFNEIKLCQRTGRGSGEKMNPCVR